MPEKKKRYRPDMDGSFQSAYAKARRGVLAEAEVCAICGLPLDKKLRFPHPMSATADHIIPVSKGGHPADPANLQAVHLICNQVKGSRLTIEANKNIQKEAAIISNQELPLLMDWIQYRG